MANLVIMANILTSKNIPRYQILGPYVIPYLHGNYFNKKYIEYTLDQRFKLQKPSPGQVSKPSAGERTSGLSELRPYSLASTLHPHLVNFDSSSPVNAVQLRVKQLCFEGDCPRAHSQQP